MRTRTTLAALTLGFAPLALIAPPPAYAAPKPWHIINVIASNGPANIYSLTGCSASGSIVILDPGEDAQSTGWDSFKVYGRGFNVLVYDGSTGALLADRSYSAGTCVRAYPSNDYRIQAT